MGFDLVLLNPFRVESLAGGAEQRNFGFGLSRRLGMGVGGTVTFVPVTPTGQIIWLTGQVNSVTDLSDPSLRLRLVNELEDAYYYNEEQARWLKVTVANWDSEYALPYHN